MKAAVTSRARQVRGTTCAKYFAAMLREAVERTKSLAWPSPVYAADPVGFVRHVLGETPLPHQIAILESVRDNFKTAVRSGQKTGKTKTAIWLALWWFCTRPKGRVFMLAAIKEQVDRVLWTELKATVQDAQELGFEINTPIPRNPATGVISSDGREMRGLTVRDVEALAGLSGDVLFIVDEASHMPLHIAEAVEGNCAGGGRMLWISNPTRTDGPFYDAFNHPDVAAFWTLLHISAEAVAEYQHANGLMLKGLADRIMIANWADEKKRESPFFVVRVLGDFLRNETGRINPLGDIDLAQKTWESAEEIGELRIGVDPSGPADGGDEYAFCVTRGKKMLALHAKPGLSEDAAVEFARSLLAVHRRGDETPWLIVDVDGPIGASLGHRLSGISQALLVKRPKEAFSYCGVKASHHARREPAQYERVREELWANGAKWLREGGAIIADHKLATELHAPMWLGSVGGKLRVTPKNDLRASLGRSPDRADAFLLSVWEPAPWRHQEAAPAATLPQDDAAEEIWMDPYAGMASAGGGGGDDGEGGGFDPYA